MSDKWDPSSKCTDAHIGEYNIDEALTESRRWIEAVSGKNFPYEDFRKALEDGVLLCQLMSKIKPGSIRKINQLPTTYAGLDNINQFLRACESLGLSGSQIFDACDLQDVTRGRLTTRDIDELKRGADRKLKNVCITVYWLGKTAAGIKKYRGPQLNLSAFTQLLSPSNLTKDLESSNHSLDGACSPIHSPNSSTDQSGKSYSLNNNLVDINHVKMDPSYHQSNRYSGMYDYNYSRENGYKDSNANKSTDEFEPTFHQKQKDDYGKRRYSMPVAYSHPKPTQYIVAAKIEHKKQPSQEKEFIHSVRKRGDYGEPDEEVTQFGRQKKDLDEEQNQWMSSLSSWKTKRIKATSTARERKAELEEQEQEEEKIQRRGSKTFAQMLEDREERERALLSIVQKPEDETREELNRILTEVPLEYNSDSEQSQQSVSSAKDAEPEEPKSGYYGSSPYGRSPRYAPQPAKRYSPERSVPSVAVSQPIQPPRVAPRRFQRREASPVESNRSDVDSSFAPTKPVIFKSVQPQSHSQPHGRSDEVARPAESRFSENQVSERKPVERKPFESRYSEQPTYTHRQAEEPSYTRRQAEEPTYARRQAEEPTYARRQAEEPAYAHRQIEEPRQEVVTRRAEPQKVDLNAMKTAEKKRVSSGIKDRLEALNANQQVKEDNRKSEAFNEMTICINQRPNSDRGFGFSVSGGIDEERPVTVQSVARGGSADICELCAGDEIISINNQNITHFTHDAVVHAISQAVITGNLQLKIRRYGERGPGDSQSNRMKIHMSAFEEDKVPDDSIPPRTEPRKRESRPQPQPVPVMAPEVETIEAPTRRVEVHSQYTPVPTAQEETPEPPSKVEPQYKYTPIGRVTAEQEEIPKPVERPPPPPETAPRQIEVTIVSRKTVETQSQKPAEVAPKRDDRIRFVSRISDKPKFEVKPITFDLSKSPPKKPQPLKLLTSDDDDILYYGEGGESVGELSPSEEERLEREIMEQLEKEEEEARQQEEMHRRIEDDEHHRKESETDDEPPPLPSQPPPPLPSQPPPSMTSRQPRRERGREVVKREIWKRRHEFFPDSDKENESDEPFLITETKKVNDDVEALWKQVEKMPAKKVDEKQEEKISDMFDDFEKLPPMQSPMKRFDIEEERRKLEKWQEEQDEQRRQKYLNERKRLQEQYLKDLERIHEEMLRNRERQQEKLEKYEQELFSREPGARARQEIQQRREDFIRDQRQREEEYQQRKADLMAIYEQEQRRLAEEEHFETQEDKLKHEESTWTLEKDKEEDKKQEIEVKKKHIERKRRRTRELEIEKLRLEAEAQLKKEWEELEREKQRQQERELIAQQKLEEIRREQEKLNSHKLELERQQKEELRQLEEERKKLRSNSPPTKATNLMPRTTYSKFAALGQPEYKKESNKAQKSVLKKPNASEQTEAELKKTNVPQSNLSNKDAYHRFAAIPHGDEDTYQPQPQEQQQPQPQIKKSYTLESRPNITSPKHATTSPNTLTAEQPVKKERPFLTQAQFEPAYNQYYKKPQTDVPERDVVDHRRTVPEKAPPTQAPVPQQRNRVQPERDFAPKHSLMSKYRDESAPAGQHWLIEEAERRRRAEREGYDRGSPYEITPPRKTSPMPAEKPQRDVPPPTEMRYDERYMYAPPERDLGQRMPHENEAVRMRPHHETKAERKEKLQKRRTVHEMEPDNRAREYQNIERKQRSFDDSDRRPQAQTRHSLQGPGPYSSSSENIPHGVKKNNGPLPDNVIQNLTHRTGNRGIGSQRSPSSPQRYPYASQPPTAAVPPAPAGNKQPSNRSVSGKVLCTKCGTALGKGAAMIIESLGLHFHMHCFKCCVCNVQLGNGAKGTDVRIRASRLHCQNCYSNDAGFEFTEV
ncbi:LIM domain only protein 7-like isoform X7 [Ptychodera flava]|uniref:LIM domain only protein 7-like isoform X7 n=2 Tax=Ptychodera flava TaxID=63121 RepID=UPI00396A24A1